MSVYTSISAHIHSIQAMSICIPAMQTRGSSGATMRLPWPILHEPSAYRRDHMAIEPLRQSSRKPQTSVGIHRHRHIDKRAYALNWAHIRLYRSWYAASAELARNCNRHGHVQSKGVTTMGRLADKNILITGGNSGIGLAAAQEFDREGARVAICG